MDQFDDKYEGITTYDIVELFALNKIKNGDSNLNLNIPKEIWKQTIKKKNPQ